MRFRGESEGAAPSLLRACGAAVERLEMGWFSRAEDVIERRGSREDSRPRRKSRYDALDAGEKNRQRIDTKVYE